MRTGLTTAPPGSISSGIRRPAVWRSIVIAAAVLAVLLFLRLIPKTVEVFVVATLLAYSVNPIVRRLARRLPRMVAIAFVYGTLLVGVLVAGVIIIPDTIGQLQSFFGNSSTYLDATQHLFDRFQTWLHMRFRTHVLPPQFQDIEGHALTQLSNLFNAAVQSIGTIVLSIANMLLIGITAVILSYYFLTHVDDIKSSFFSIFPERSQGRARLFAHEVSRVFGGFVIGQIILSAFSGIGTFLVLALMGSEYALLLGVVTGVLYAIPYVGVLVAILIGILLGLLQSTKMALITAIVIFGVTRISDYVLVPKVMAESVGVSPIAIIFAVFAGGELFGLVGLIFAIPAAALFKVVWNLWIYPWLTGRPPPLVAVDDRLTSDPVRQPPAGQVPMPAPTSQPSTATDARS